MFNNIPENKKLIITEIKNFIMLILILIDLIFVTAILFHPLTYTDVLLFTLFDLGVCLLLFLDLINEYKKSNDSPKIFLKKHIIDILSIIPYNIIFLNHLSFLRFFKVVQILQLFKLLGWRKSSRSPFRYFVQEHLLKVLTVILVVYIIISSIILVNIDPNFQTFFNAIWYNVVTMTGVGYGDITPVTDDGKILGMFTIIMGVLFVSIFTAAMSSLYMEKNEEKTRKSLKKSANNINENMADLEKRIEVLESNMKEINEKLDKIIDLNEKKLK
ncbi:MAG: hypothetical protein E7Z84_05630 [Methanosphaera stadtmanae]|nr:hypothetical protein [Methanosphaera stadtmanae]